MVNLPLVLLKQFDENKVAWVAGLATIGAVEFMAAAVALFILRRLQVRDRLKHRKRNVNQIFH